VGLRLRVTELDLSLDSLHAIPLVEEFLRNGGVECMCFEGARE
jgi:hypothetical protein